MSAAPTGHKAEPLYPYSRINRHPNTLKRKKKKKKNKKNKIKIK